MLVLCKEVFRGKLRDFFEVKAKFLGKLGQSCHFLVEVKPKTGGVKRFWISVNGSGCVDWRISQILSYGIIESELLWWDVREWETPEEVLRSRLYAVFFQLFGEPRIVEF